MTINSLSSNLSFSYFINSYIAINIILIKSMFNMLFTWSFIASCNLRKIKLSLSSTKMVEAFFFNFPNLFESFVLGDDLTLPFDYWKLVFSPEYYFEVELPPLFDYCIYCLFVVKNCSKLYSYLLGFLFPNLCFEPSYDPLSEGVSNFFSSFISKYLYNISPILL